MGGVRGKEFGRGSIRGEGGRDSAWGRGGDGIKRWAGGDTGLGLGKG